MDIPVEKVLEEQKSEQLRHHLEEEDWKLKFELGEEKWEQLLSPLSKLGAALEQNPGYLFDLGEDKEANMEIDHIMEDLERRQGSPEEVRLEANFLFQDTFSEWRGDQRTDP